MAEAAKLVTKNGHLVYRMVGGAPKLLTDANGVDCCCDWRQAKKCDGDEPYDLWYPAHLATEGVVFSDEDAEPPIPCAYWSDVISREPGTKLTESQFASLDTFANCSICQCPEPPTMPCHPTTSGIPTSITASTAFSGGSFVFMDATSEPAWAGGLTKSSDPFQCVYDNDGYPDYTQANGKIVTQASAAWVAGMNRWGYGIAALSGADQDYEGGFYEWGEVVQVWYGYGGCDPSDPTGTYTRESGIDMTTTREIS